MERRTEPSDRGLSVAQFEFHLLSVVTDMVGTSNRDQTEVVVSV